MKINRRKNNKKKIALFVALGVFFIFILTAWLTYHYQLWPFLLKDKNVQNIDLNTSDKTNPTTKSQVNSKSDNNFDKNTSEIPISNETSIRITSLSQDGQSVVFSANIINPSDGGECSATFTKKDSMPVIVNEEAKYDKCGPTSIPSNRFDSLGEWTLTLRDYANDTQSIAISTVKVQ